MLLGHYTSVAGLKGILEDEELWATNIKYLNDEHEFDHALELVRKVLPTGKRQPGDFDYHQFRAFLEKVENAIRETERDYHADVFTCSFSAETDLLSQWRGYCPDGNGYSLVCETDGIVKTAKATIPFTRFVQCVYDDSEKEKIIRDKLNEYYQDYTRSDLSDMDSISGDLALELTVMAASFKDSTFSEERESRLVIMTDGTTRDRVKFRGGRSCLVPYVPLPFPRPALQYVVVGPTIDKRRAESSLALFLRTIYSVGQVPNIVASRTPYRSW